MPAIEQNIQFSQRLPAKPFSADCYRHLLPNSSIDVNCGTFFAGYDFGGVT